MYECGSRNQAVLDRHRPSGSTQVSEKPCPSQPCCQLPRKAAESRDAVLEPLPEPAPAPVRCQQVNAEAYLAYDDRVDDEVTFVLPQPLDHLRVRAGPGRLAEPRRLDE